MSLVDNVTQYYAARASVYDETAGYTDPEVEDLRLPIKTRYQDILKDHTVLEIACGTGYWTSTIAQAAKSVLAVDINTALISQAKERCKNLPNVRFQIADAYTLKGVPTGFSAALGIWWWSHIPVERITAFLKALHSKLDPGAIVLFVDQLPYDGFIRRHDPRGNTIEQRTLPDGRLFEIVKNFPKAQDIHIFLSDVADNVQFIERPEEKSWNLIYNVKT